MSCGQMAVSKCRSLHMSACQMSDIRPWYSVTPGRNKVWHQALVQCFQHQAAVLLSMYVVTRPQVWGTWHHHGLFGRVTGWVALSYKSVRRGTFARESVARCCRASRAAALPNIVIAVSEAVHTCVCSETRFCGCDMDVRNVMFTTLLILIILCIDFFRA